MICAFVGHFFPFFCGRQIILLIFLFIFLFFHFSLRFFFSSICQGYLCCLRFLMWHMIEINMGMCMPYSKLWWWFIFVKFIHSFIHCIAQMEQFCNTHTETAYSKEGSRLKQKPQKYLTKHLRLMLISKNYVCLSKNSPVNVVVCLIKNCYVFFYF